MTRGPTTVISYSHTADELLAPRLQSAVQRFAKPWYQLRALRLFRDEAVPAADPSRWRRPWPRNRSPSTLLIVVTEGTARWQGDDFDQASTAIPPILFGVLPTEPRWLDLTWARGADR